MKNNRLSNVLYIIAVLMIVISLIIKEPNGIKLYNLAFVIGIIGSGIKTIRKNKEEKGVWIVIIVYGFLAMPFIYQLLK